MVRAQPRPGEKIHVLVVDDSAVVRQVMQMVLGIDRNIRVSVAADPIIALSKIARETPDVVITDLEMPRMDGLTFLRRLMHFHPMPVIVISSVGQASCQAAVEALHAGAVDVLAKPGGPYSVGDLRLELPHRIRAAAAARLLHPHTPGAGSAASPFTHFHPQSVVAMGASTGGTEAIEAVLTRLPPAPPAIVIAQHMPPGFTRAFADRLNRICALEIKEAAEGDEPLPGRALIAPGDLHLRLARRDGKYQVQLDSGPRVCYQRPSVDVLFRSVAESAGRHAVGVLLTGMGSDGAEGLLALRQRGGRTIVQDESTCVVFGMPREAIRLEAVEQVLPLERIPAAILSALSPYGPPQTSTSSQFTTLRS